MQARLLRSRLVLLTVLVLCFSGLALAAPVAQPSKAQPPKFDVVRVDRDGTAVIAGRAPRGAEVSVLDGETVIAVVTADRNGEWVILTDDRLPGGSRRLRLRAKLADGRVLESVEDLLIAVPRIDDAGNVSGGGPADQGGVLALLLAKKPGGMSRLLQRPEPDKGLSRFELGLSTIDYDAQGVTALQGSARPNTPVRLYLDGQLVGEFRSAASGRWSLRLSMPVSLGAHMLRLDQLAADGGVSERIEVPFQREGAPPIPGIRTKMPQKPKAPKQPRGEATIVVKSGESLWKIARQSYGAGTRYTLIFRANKKQIRDPNVIYPGQVLALPTVRE